MRTFDKLTVEEKLDFLKNKMPHERLLMRLFIIVSFIGSPSTRSTNNHYLLHKSNSNKCRRSL